LVCDENIIFIKKKGGNVAIGELNYDDIFLNYIYTPDWEERGNNITKR
jgi:hypothetical protein